MSGKLYDICVIFKTECGVTETISVPGDYDTLEEAGKDLIEQVNEGELGTKSLDWCGPTFVGLIETKEDGKTVCVDIPEVVAESHAAAEVQNSLDELLGIFDEEMGHGVAWESGDYGPKIRRARAALAHYSQGYQYGPAWVDFLATATEAFTREDEPINGGDVVDWYTNIFRPAADKLLGRVPKEEEHDENDRVHGEVGNADRK